MSEPWYERPFKVRIYQVREDQWVGEAFWPPISDAIAPSLLPDFTAVHPTREEVVSAIQQHIRAFRVSSRERAARRAIREAAPVEDWL